MIAVNNSYHFKTLTNKILILQCSVKRIGKTQPLVKLYETVFRGETCVRKIHPTSPNFVWKQPKLSSCLWRSSNRVH